MELTIEKAKFHQISLKQVSEALNKGLSKNYNEVDVSIVECPDLRKWYIKYMRLATQLNRLNNKLTCMDKLHWRGTHQQLSRAK